VNPCILELCREITDIINSNSNSFICCTGDYNAPDINWENESIEHHNYPISINQAILQMLANCGFSQSVNFPRNTLDLVFTNRPFLVDQCCGTPGLSDHDMVSLSLQCYIPKNSCSYKRFLWHKADFESMKRELCDFANNFMTDYSIEVCFS